MKAARFYSFNNAFAHGCACPHACSSHAMDEYFAYACLAAACAFVLALISVIALGAVISVIICVVIIITGDNRIWAKKVLRL